MKVCSASIASVEDHGYILDIGLPDVSGFLSFKEASYDPWSQKKLGVGYLLDVCVLKMSGNGRTCNVTVKPDTIRTASVSRHPLEFVPCDLRLTMVSSRKSRMSSLSFRGLLFLPS